MAVGDDLSLAISPAFLLPVLSLSSVVPILPLYAGAPTVIPCALCNAQLDPSKVAWANYKLVKHWSVDRYQETRQGEGKECLLNIAFGMLSG